MEDERDLVNAFDGVTFDSVSAETVSESSAIIWLDEDDAGNPCICKSIPDTTASISGTFVRSDNSTYESTSADFIGGRPRKPRP